MICKCKYRALLALSGLALSGVEGAGSSLRSKHSAKGQKNGKDLQRKIEPINLIKLGDMVATVEIKQTIFGHPDNCDNPGSQDTVQFMFATYLDPVTLELACGAVKRDADACYSKELIIGCDPETKSASIAVYVTDETFDKSLTTDNPMIGRCKLGKGESIRGAIKFTETFECAPSAAGKPVLCSDTVDDCPGGSYCSYSPKKGYQCRDYVLLGSECGGKRPAGEEMLCNPNEAYCFDPFNCIITDQQGTCAAFGGDCKSDKNCEDLKNYYCDQLEGKCKEKLQEGYCCEPDNDLCSKGLTCIGDGYDNPYVCKADVSGTSGLQVCSNEVCGGFAGFSCDCICEDGSSPLCVDDPNDSCDPANGGADCLGLCQCGAPQVSGTCSENSDECPRGTFCNYSPTRGYECKDYVELGSKCGGKRPAGEEMLCNPNVAYCFDPFNCIITDQQGTCAAFHGSCKSDKNCEVLMNFYCDQLEGKCKEKLQEGYCCDPADDLCGEGLICVGDGYENPYVCKADGSGTTPLEICSNEVCGGFAGSTCNCACEDGYAPTCVDDPNDSCDPTNGGADCSGLCQCRAPETSGTCSEESPECPKGSFCNFSPERGYECKKYSPIGGICGGRTRLGETNVCNPDEGFCLDQTFCFVGDALGTCAPYYCNCNSDQDCDDPDNRYCDEEEGKCKDRLTEDACCIPELDQCGSGLECTGDGTVIPFKCRAPETSGTCSEDSPECPKGRFCNFAPERGYECKNYSPIGGRCGGRTRLGETNVCNPDEGFCLDLKYCVVGDALGTCAPYYSDCTSDQDCDDPDNRYCDEEEGKCKDRLTEDSCCIPELNQCGSGLECTGDGTVIPFKCTPAADSSISQCNDDFCGGKGGFPCNCICEKDFFPTCVDNPNDGCDPEKGGADCGGICKCRLVEG